MQTKLTYQQTIQPKFILRSQRIESNSSKNSKKRLSYKQIDLLNEQTQNKKHKINLKQYYGQLNSQQSQKIVQSELNRKDKQIQQKLYRLNSNLKYLQKQYKNNLKEGFDQKIKSYRLQAVMQRKIFKQTVQQSLKKKQLSKIKQKQQQIKQQKQNQSLKFIYKQNEQIRRLDQLRTKFQINKRKLKYQVQRQQIQLQKKNRSLHDRIKSQQKYKDRKKNYLQFWKHQQVKKNDFEMKKQYLQKIVNNTKKLIQLKDKLDILKQRDTQFQSLRTINREGTAISNSLFITL